MTTPNKKAVFLATTALEEFWDTSKPVVFLGEWCRRYSRRSFWEPFNGEVINSRWPERGKLLDVYNYVNNLYEQLLSCLAEALNSIHNVNYSKRYWRIVLGPWLFHYIHILYDRYMSLRVVIEDYPEFTTYLLAENNFIVPKSTIDFILLSCDDPYNLQIYTKILSLIGKDFPRKNYEIISKPHGPQKDSIKRLVLNNLSKLFRFNYRVILNDPYFNRLTELKIVMRTQWKVFPNINIMTKLPAISVDSKKREDIAHFLPSGNEFYYILKNTLPTDIPICYVEAYKYIEHEMHANYPAAPEGIVSAISWYFDEPFKQWAAFSAENGTKLMGIQHGGNYGSCLFMAVEDHELAITDKFYSWGWERSGCYAKVVVMPATKLSSRKSLGECKEKRGILFVGTATPRYLCRFQDFNNYRFADYLQWQLKFVNGILPKMHNELRVRPHNEEYGWDNRQRWEEAFPDLPIEGRQVPFLKSLENCRLYVCDHLSTTFVEALAANKPTILFWDPFANELREEAKPYYDALHSVGILYYSPQDAAKAVNVVYDDIESWWNEPSRQDARQFFCNRFAKTSADPVKEWVNEFKRTVDVLENRQ